VHCTQGLLPFRYENVEQGGPKARPVRMKVDVRLVGEEVGVQGVGEDDGALFGFEGFEAVLFESLDLEVDVGDVDFLLVGFDLHVDEADDVVDVEGELFVVQFFWILLGNEVRKEGLELLVFGDDAEGGLDAGDFVVGEFGQPGEPDFDVALFTEEFLGRAATGGVGEEVVERCEDGCLLDPGVGEELELSIHVVSEGSQEEGGIGPGGAFDLALCTDFGGGGLRGDVRAEGDAFLGVEGCHDGGHGVGIASRVGEYTSDDSGGVVGGGFVEVAQFIAAQRDSGIGVGDGDLLAGGVEFALVPCSLEVDAAVGNGIVAAFPVGDAVLDEHVAPYDLGAGLAEAFHEERVAVVVDILDDAEDAELGVDGADVAFGVQPDLCEVVADEGGAGHGGGGLAATGGGCAIDPDDGAVVHGDAGDEHVLGEAFAAVAVDGVVVGEAVVPFLDEGAVAEEGDVPGPGFLVFAVGEDVGGGCIQISLRVGVGHEEADEVDLFLEAFGGAAVEEVLLVEEVPAI